MSTPTESLYEILLSIYYRGKDQKGYSEHEIRQDLSLIEVEIAKRENALLDELEAILPHFEKGDDHESYLGKELGASEKVSEFIAKKRKETKE